MNSILEWFGCICGLLGALLLATNTRASRYGWWAFLAANILMLVFAFNKDLDGLLVQQVGFLATSILGLYKVNLLPKYLDSFIRNRNKP